MKKIVIPIAMVILITGYFLIMNDFEHQNDTIYFNGELTIEEMLAENPYNLLVLSVRGSNCLVSARINTTWDLVKKYHKLLIVLINHTNKKNTSSTTFNDTTLKIPSCKLLLYELKKLCLNEN